MKELLVKRVDEAFTREMLTAPLRDDADSTAVIDTYWSGDPAPPGRKVLTAGAWNDRELCFRFDAVQTEPLVVCDLPVYGSKTDNLWERDVCEVFIAPDPGEPRKYFEFEAAPTGEWIDLRIDLTGGVRVADQSYHSGMTAAGRIDDQQVHIGICIPWEAFGKRPEAGEVWLGNLFRCVGSGAGRGYLAWSPTLTPEPQFHVPEAFGRFVFTQ